MNLYHEHHNRSMQRFVPTTYLWVMLAIQRWIPQGIDQQLLNFVFQMPSFAVFQIFIATFSIDFESQLNR